MSRTVDTTAPAAFRLHPATRIAVCLAFAVAVSWAGWIEVALLGLPVLAWSAWRREPRPLRMLWRARWLLLSLLLIYGFATPGTPLLPWESGPSLSLEGVELGLIQALRISLMIGALALLLGATGPAEMVAGLLVLLRPLRALGADPGRIALRLSLTLHYAGEMAAEVRRDWRATLAAAFGPGVEPGEPVRIEQQPFTWRDGFAGLLACGLILVLG